MSNSKILLNRNATSSVSLLKSEIITSDISNFASFSISGNLFRVSSTVIIEVVSFVAVVKTEALGNTLEIDFASEPSKDLVKTSKNTIALSMLFKGI